MNYLNRLVVGLFQALGGSMEKKRPLTHWFYFQKKEDLLEFEIYMNQIGFSTHFKQIVKENSKEELLLIVERNEKINEDSLNFDTEEFRKTAVAYHGEYDGWETEIEQKTE